MYVHGLPSGRPGSPGAPRLLGRAPAARAAGCRSAPVLRWRCENPWQPPALGRSPIATGVERVQPLRRVFGQTQADGGANLGAEVAQLLHGLVGARCRAIRRAGWPPTRSTALARSWLPPRPDPGWPRRCPTSSRCTPARPRRSPGRWPENPRCARQCGRATASARSGRRRAARTPAAHYASPGITRHRERRRGSARQRRCGPVSSTGSFLQGVTARSGA